MVMHVSSMRIPKSDVQCYDRMLECVSATATVFTAATTLSTVKPKCLNSTPPGADSPKRVDADDGAVRIVDGADVLAPAVGDAGLDGDARHAARQHAIARYAASCRSNTLVHGIDTTRTAMPSSASAFARAERERDFGAGGDDHRALRRSRVAVGEHVAAAADRRDRSRVARLTNGTFWRVNSEAGRSVARARSRRPTRAPISTVSHGPPDVQCGNEAQARRVLDRLMRRAVLAQADRVVRVHEDRCASFISAAMRSALRA